jgi:hypothetical protein
VLEDPPRVTLEEDTIEELEAAESPEELDA